MSSAAPASDSGGSSIPDVLGQVRQQVRLAPGVRDDVGPAAHPRPACAEDLADGGQLVEIGAQDRAGLSERGRADPGVAGQLPGMGDDPGLGCRRPTDLAHRQRLAGLGQRSGGGQEAGRIAEPLDEGEDGVRPLVGGEEGQVLGQAGACLRAARDDGRERDAAAVVDEGLNDRATLGDDADPSPPDVHRDGPDVRGGSGHEVDEAHAVGADDRDPPLRRERPQLGRELERGRTGVRVACSGDHEASRTDRHAFPDGLEDPVRPQLDEDDIRCLRQVRERRRGGQAADLRVLRIDGIEAALIAQCAAVLQRDPPHERARARPNDGDGARPEDRSQVHGTSKRTWPRRQRKALVPARDVG